MTWTQFFRLGKRQLPKAREKKSVRDGIFLGNQFQCYECRDIIKKKETILVEVKETPTLGVFLHKNCRLRRVRIQLEEAKRIQKDIIDTYGDELIAEEL